LEDDAISDTFSIMTQNTFKPANAMIKFKERVEPIKVPHDAMVVDIITEALKLFDLPKDTENEYVIHKNDRNSPILRTFLSTKDPIWSLAIEDGVSLSYVYHSG
jgi:hypothetical protein